MKILLTGGRAPATLELARCFHRAGHEVHVAESLGPHLSRPSRALTRSHMVPPPRQQTAAFIDAIASIVAKQGIDLLIPTCEEVFYIARGRDRFACRVLVEPLERLDTLHNKLRFAAQAAAYGLPVPETRLIRSEADLLRACSEWGDLVLKPAYSRFASAALIRPTLVRARRALFSTPRLKWIAQPYVPGRQVCTYSVCEAGRLLAHTAYPSDFTAGQGATIVFRHIEHAASQEWVQCFVERFGFSGQIAFDFIEGRDGQLVALECNPRATSGVHLLAACPQFAGVFTRADLPLLTPPAGAQPRMLASAMWVYGLPAALASGRLRPWLAALLSARDVIFDWRDPVPALLQLRSIVHYLGLARRRHITALQASTYDIEWNGEGEPG